MGLELSMNCYCWLIIYWELVWGICCIWVCCALFCSSGIWFFDLRAFNCFWRYYVTSWNILVSVSPVFAYPIRPMIRKAFTNSLNGKLLSGDGSGMLKSLLLPRDFDLSAITSWLDQNSLFFNTIFLRSSKVMTTGYILQSLHNLKNSIAEILLPSPEKLLKTT